MPLTNVLKKRLAEGESTQSGISRWAALGLILSMTACTSLTAASGPNNCAEAQSTSDVVFCQDFDGSAVGDWSVNDLKSDFPGTSGFIAGPTGAPNGTGNGRTTIVSGVDAVSGNSLRAKLPKNTLGSGSGVLFRAPIGASLTEAYIGYWVRFDPSFPDVKGGKLPGLEGGTTDAGQVSPCCGRPMKKGLGFSTRMMFVGGRRFVNYFYWIDNPTPPNSSGTTYGGPRGVIDTWIPGKWYFIEEHVKLNSPAGASNGLFEVWINGTKVTTIANTRIRGPGANFSIEPYPIPNIPWRRRFKLVFSYRHIQLFRCSGCLKESYWRSRRRLKSRQRSGRH